MTHKFFNGRNIKNLCNELDTWLILTNNINIRKHKANNKYSSVLIIGRLNFVNHLHNLFIVAKYEIKLFLVVYGAV